MFFEFFWMMAWTELCPTLLKANYFKELYLGVLDWNPQLPTRFRRCVTQNISVSVVYLLQFLLQPPVAELLPGKIRWAEHIFAEFLLDVKHQNDISFLS